MFSSVLGNWVGWYYIPNFVTKYAIQALHQLYPSLLRTPPPQPGTLEYQRHYRYTYATVVLGYLLYNLIDGSSSMPINFYEVLQVSPDVDENGLKQAFRQFARANHPDRVGPAGQALFITVRDVYEALKNPVVRFAYDRFGPDVVHWQGLTTTRDYLRHGLIHSSGYHIVTFLFLFIVSSIGRPSPAKYWRYLLYSALFVLELSFLIKPASLSPGTLPVFGSQASVLQVLFPNRVSYQHVLFLHQLFIFLGQALTNIAPMLLPSGPSEREIVLERLNLIASAADREASILLHTELHSIHPFKEEDRTSVALMRPCIDPSPDLIEELSDEMEQHIIEKNLMQESGPLRSAWEGAIKRGRRQRARTHLRPDSIYSSQQTDINPSESLPSPISPRSSPAPEPVTKAEPHSPGRLPSPRPSPPPPHFRTGSRARSVSY